MHRSCQLTSLSLRSLACYNYVMKIRNVFDIGDVYAGGVCAILLFVLMPWYQATFVWLFAATYIFVTKNREWNAQDRYVERNRIRRAVRHIEEERRGREH